ncbi:hypothetical protein M433DRAFT_238010 [Acidomyces richmondensis BFW]|nr:hypothetical protein M433DRAFT_238010 [Acidomyces richmondensis BFW]
MLPTKPLTWSFIASEVWATGIGHESTINWSKFAIRSVNMKLSATQRILSVRKQAFYLYPIQTRVRASPAISLRCELAQESRKVHERRSDPK